MMMLLHQVIQVMMRIQVMMVGLMIQMMGGKHRIEIKYNALSQFYDQMMGHKEDDDAAAPGYSSNDENSSDDGWSDDSDDGW
mmetsp:Transcript_10702/g.16034  ORF Transcript_10702/g.16034 Transcript_10702/m.16034 type:complete len:82 (+) Transcript_10702:49-294(+)